MRRILLLSAVLAASVAPAVGAPAAPVDAQEEIAQLIRDLRNESWAVRESAEKRLLEIGEPAREALEAAAKSDDPEVRQRALKALEPLPRRPERLVKELGTAPTETDRYLHISPNGERVAYILERDGKEILVCDGKEGPAWDGIEYTGGFSRDGTRFGYQAVRGGQAFVVFVGEEDKPIPKGAVAKGWLSPRAAYSPDGKRVAYAVSQDGEQVMVCDGREGPHYKGVDTGQFSPDGRRFAYTAEDDKGNKFVVLDGKTTGPYEGIGITAFSPDGRRFAYTARQAGKMMVVCDGTAGKVYDEVFYPLFSPDGKSLAYWARSADRKKKFVIRDEKEVAQLAGEPRLAFSPDGRVLACGTYDGEMYRFGEKVERLATGYDGASRPVWSADSRHIAYAVGKNMTWWVCVDGKSLPGRYDPETVRSVDWEGPNGRGTRMMMLESPGFSADGRHVFFKGFRGPRIVGPGLRRRFIVCDGVELPEHDGVWIPDDFKNHAERLRYAIRDGARIRLVEAPWPEPLSWQDVLEPAQRAGATDAPN